MKSFSSSVLAFVLVATSASAIGAENNRLGKTLTADQAIACIKLAVGARAGQVSELEVDIDNGRTVCEVELVGADGREHEVYVDVAANKVLRIDN